MAVKRAAVKNVDSEMKLERVRKEFDAQGELLFSFDSGTSPALKQLRQLLLMSGAGSLNLEMDEVGSNLVNNDELLTTMLELYDSGMVKTKLIKNTVDNKRSKEIRGVTPANAMLFGTPSKLLDGGIAEKAFIDKLDTGYARRSLFGYSDLGDKVSDLTPEEIFDLLTSTGFSKDLEEVSTQLAELADIGRFGMGIFVSKEVSIELIAYKVDCEKRAAELPEYEDIRKAEMSHRYFKALKTAGAYAFADSSHEICFEHLWGAIKLVEEGGAAFDRILTRERPYVKLAKYLCTKRKVKREFTLVDLYEDLPFFRGSESAKRELISMATAWGYKNNCIIKRSYDDGIEMLSGETLELTSLDELIVSHSHHITENFNNQLISFDKLRKLTQSQRNWTNHHLSAGYRDESHCIQGTNLLVLDVDSDTSIDTVKLLFKAYKYHIYTTKSHTDKHNRFRIVMPMSHVLKLSADDYKDFMRNVYDWLPFAIDEQTCNRTRKWASHNMKFYENDGELLDVLPFIPKTERNVKLRESVATLSSLSNLERWFMHNTAKGNRNGNLLRYAMVLVDMGYTIEQVSSAVLQLNGKLPDKMEDGEIQNTILVSAQKAILKRDM